MSRTLFWYIFRDLLRIFFMASGALAGIMSFGGLLRPLTHQGLDASQVGRMLSYLTPAMTTYSLPVAALFATTMVYGRLSADNELTAARRPWRLQWRCIGKNTADIEQYHTGNIAIIMMIIILLLRPQGLFGRRS